jgi:hypothetical protein
MNNQRLFPLLLGDAWNALPSVLRSFHGDTTEMHANGMANVERGKGWLASLVAKIFGFPEADQEVPVVFSAFASKTSERWTRTFGGRSFFSELTLGVGKLDKLLCERFGPFKFGIALVVEEDRLHFIVRSWSLFNIPLPTAWAPGGNSYEFEENGKFHFHVEIAQPFIGTIVRYRGWLVSRKEKHLNPI